MRRTQLLADPSGVFVHDLVMRAADRFPNDVAIVDTSCDPIRRIRFAEYADLIDRLSSGFVSAGIRPRDVIAIYLFNSWEFCAAYHAATLAGAIPTPINPSYRERELRYQLEASGASLLITDGPLVSELDLTGLPKLRRAFWTRRAAPGIEPFSQLLAKTDSKLPELGSNTQKTIAALPFSSGTTGLPKGVMLTHSNLVSNVYQLLAPDTAVMQERDHLLCFLPLYHIYGLNVALNPTFAMGLKLVLMSRFDVENATRLIREEGISFFPAVPPVLNVLSQACERDAFPRDHQVRCVKSGAAPLAAEVARRFTANTGIPVVQGYGMTEASPVTHMGVVSGPLAKPESIGFSVPQTDCHLVDIRTGAESDGPGELVMRGPQFMQGYWNSPEATADVLRDGWYWSGDIATRDDVGRYTIIDRRKEMIKYKGFSVAPAEVEAVLMEHPAIRDCGVVGRADDQAGEIPCAFIVLREGFPESEKLKSEISGFVAERLTHYKQPRQVEFVAAVPRNPSGKILRRKLREQLPG